MSVPVQRRPGVGTSLGSQQSGLDALERWPPGRWVYVGDYPTDPDTTPDSPPFENGWSNAGGGDRRLRFRRTNEWGLEIAGSVTGGVAGTVVTTLPDLYRITETEYAASGTPGGGIAVWKFATNGQLTYMASINFANGTDPVNALHWGSNVDTGADGLHLQLGAATFMEILDSASTALLQIFENGSIFLDADTSGQNVEIFGFDVQLGATEDVEAFSDTFGAFADTTAALAAGPLSFTLESVLNRIAAFLVSGATFKVFDSGGNPLIEATDGGNIVLNTPNSAQIQGSTEIDLFCQDTWFVLVPTEIQATLDVGAKFTIYDSNGDPMFQMTEGSPDIHIPTGGSVIADL